MRIKVICARQKKFDKFSAKRDMLTIEQQPSIDKGDVPREEKQDFDRCPPSVPDE